MLPFAVSYCDFLVQTNGGSSFGTTPTTIRLNTKLTASVCLGWLRLTVSGGFGWVAPTSGCATTSVVGQNLPSSPGLSVPSACSTADFVAVQNQTVLLPVYDSVGGNGANAYYHVYGYAAFTVTGYSFPGQYTWNGAGCTGADRCLKGYFTRFVDLSETYTYSSTAPQLGASVVRLTT